MRKPRPLVLLVVLTVLSAGVGPTLAGASSHDVTVTVNVVDGGGNPVGNADVTATWDGGSDTATTKSNGQALFDVPAEANVTFEINHAVYVRNVPYELTNAQEESITIDVAREYEGTITVVDSSGPLAGANVTLWNDGLAVRSGTTDDAGEFQTGIIESGQYEIEVLHRGYLRSLDAIELRGDTAPQIELEAATVTVTFRVLDDHFESPQPIPNATIEGAEIGSIRTQPNGIQLASVPVNADVSITMSKPGYEPVERSFHVAESDVQLNLTTSRQPAVRLAVLSERLIAGETTLLTVVNEYGVPVPDADVYLDGSVVTATNEDGHALVTIDSTGEHTIRVESNGLTSEETTLTGYVASTETTAAPTEPSSPTDTSIPTAVTTEPVGTETNGTARAPGMVGIPGTGGAIHVQSIGFGALLGFILGVILVVQLNGRPGT